MEERRKKFLLSLNPRYIRSNGRYVDLGVDSREEYNYTILTLTLEDIVFLRSVYGNDIAKDVRIVPKKKESAKEYAMTREQKYDGCRTNRRIGRKKGVPIIIGGVLVFVLLSYAPFLKSSGKTPVVLPPVETEFKIGDNEVVQNIQDAPNYVVDEEVEEVVEEELSEVEILVKKYTDIYGLDYERVYTNLIRLTNNFTDVQYLEDLHIDGVSCKGEDIYADSLEQLIMFYVRTCKQIPTKVGLKLSDIIVDMQYDSGTDYAYLIDYVCSVVGVDRNIYYAMIQGETGFSSNLFLNSYNPIGIRTDGKWWSFDSLEEGLIEGALELRKYNRMGAYEIAEIAKIHDPDEVEYWTKLVGSIYKNEVLPNQDEIFGAGEVSRHTEVK